MAKQFTKGLQRFLHPLHGIVNGALAAWQPDSLTAGYYQVSVYNIVSSGSTPNAHFEVIAGGTTKTVTLNQSEGVSGWVPLGIFEFDGSGNELVEASKSGPGFLRIDAVQFAPLTNMIDNEDFGYLEENGLWRDSVAQGVDGTGTRLTNTPRATATWRPDSLPPGNYEVLFYKVVSPNNTTNASVEVHHNGSTSEIPIDMTSGTSGFVNLGVFEFDGSTDELVRLTKNPGTGFARADSVQFRPVEHLQSFMTDNGDPGYTEESGVWLDSSILGNSGTSTRTSGALGTASVSWRPPIIPAGTYRVEFFNVVNPSSANDANVEVHHNGGVTTIPMDHTTGNFGYVDLGIYEFDGTTDELVRLVSSSAGRLRADAVRWTPIPAAPTPPPSSAGAFATTVGADGLWGDANQDNQRTTLDALVIINALNQAALGEKVGDSSSPLDINWDGKVSALDALQLINSFSADALQSDIQGLLDDEEETWVNVVDDVFAEGGLF